MVLVVKVGRECARGPVGMRGCRSEAPRGRRLRDSEEMRGCRSEAPRGRRLRDPGGMRVSAQGPKANS